MFGLQQYSQHDNSPEQQHYRHFIHSSYHYQRFKYFVAGVIIIRVIWGYNIQNDLVFLSRNAISYGLFFVRFRK